jgi:hypothetical protein
MTNIEDFDLESTCIISSTSTSVPTNLNWRYKYFLNLRANDSSPTYIDEVFCNMCRYIESNAPARVIIAVNKKYILDVIAYLKSIGYAGEIWTWDESKRKCTRRK